MVSAAIGCAFRLALKNAQWVAAPLSMALALLFMQLTRTVHPPGQQHLQCLHSCVRAHLALGLYAVGP